jgi:NADH-quinone oxidoreductase subunit M
MEVSEAARFLNVIIFAPLVLGFLCLVLPQQYSRMVALVASAITFGLSCFLIGGFDPSLNELQFVSDYPWIADLGINYQVGIDGISLILILLTTFLMPIGILSAFDSIKERRKEFYFFLLALETGILGAFCATDLFLFYLFWESMLIPMYFIIGIWGGKARIYAATKFFLYTLVGSLLMLVAIFTLALLHKQQFGEMSLALGDLLNLNIPGGSGFSVQNLLFLAFALGFAVKVPLFPLHTWLPDAHVQAPTAGSVILAGILLKLGGYGFLRFAFPLFPQAVHYFQTTFLVLSAIAIIYGALIAFMQTDIKKLVAYSSVSHMGYVVLGLFSLNAIGMSGAIFQMISHGLATGGLFLLVGMLYDRRHTREIKDFGGITKTMPLFAVAFMFMLLASVALPGTSGFVGEFLILLGSWQASPTATIFATTGVILGAVYMLWVFQKVLLGPNLNKENANLKDMNAREIFIMVPLVATVIVFGFMPNLIFKQIDVNVAKLIEHVNTKGAEVIETEVSRGEDFKELANAGIGQ